MSWRQRINRDLNVGVPSRRLTIVCAFLLLLIACAAGFKLFLRQSFHNKQTESAWSERQVDQAPAQQLERGTAQLGTLLTPRTQSRRVAQKESLDAMRDGWRTESVAEAAKAQLNRITVLLEQPDRINSDDLSGIVASEFSCGQLWPVSFHEVFRDGAIKVRRGDVPNETATTVIHEGLAGFTEALQTLARSLRQISDLQVTFKIFRVVESSTTSVEVSAFFEASGPTSNGVLQRTSIWDTRWSHSGGSAPRLIAVEPREIEEVTVKSDRPTLFADCTESVLGSNRSYQEQLRYGAGYWIQRLEGHVSPELLVAHIGITLGDVNGDGLDDVYLCQPGGLPNRLYIQNDDGTATDRSVAAGVDLMDLSYSSLLVDLDNDGDQDLNVLTRHGILIFANDGLGRFTLRKELPGSFEFSLTATDYDNDGDLDLYVCNYKPDTTSNISQYGEPVPFHNATNGGRNALFRNDGAWTFSDVTEESGMGKNNNRWSYAASWDDYDNDGHLDLYVANDYGHNNLYRNQAGQFSDVALESDAIDANFGMSVSWGDYNRDGWMDIYIGNMYSSAGNRVMFQPRFKSQSSGKTKAAFQRLARGNTLLLNRGTHGDSLMPRFRDASTEAGVTMGRWSWGSLFADINNDGWEDLLVSNGYLTQDTKDDL